MTDPLVLDEREFLTSLTWGGGSSLTPIQAEINLKNIHYIKINGINDLKSILNTYAANTQNKLQQERLFKTVEDLNSLPKEKAIILDKLVRYSWMPDPKFYSNLSPKGAEGFAFSTTDDSIFKILSFRGYAPDEINFFDNEKVPASFILMHEARHLSLDLPDGSTKIFSWKNDPDNSTQNLLENAYSAYIPDGLFFTDKTKGAFPKVTAHFARDDDTNIKFNLSAQTQFSPSVLAGELKADSFAALMSSNNAQQYAVITESVSHTRRKAFNSNDFNHITAGALENSTYVPLTSLPQAIEITNLRAESATIKFITEHPEFNREVSQSLKSCTAVNGISENILNRRAALQCLKTKANSNFKP